MTHHHVVYTEYDLMRGYPCLRITSRPIEDLATAEEAAGWVRWAFYRQGQTTVESHESKRKEE